MPLQARCAILLAQQRAQARKITRDEAEQIVSPLLMEHVERLSRREAW